MGWNGSGTFNRSDGTRSGTQVWQDADAAGVKIRADDHDTHDQDIADGLENTVALDGQTTTTTDNAILRYDTGNSKFEGVNISASEIVGRSATGDTRGLSAATARQTIGVGSAVPTNAKALFWSSSSSTYTQGTSDTARSQLNLGTAAPTNHYILQFASSASTYQQVNGLPPGAIQMYGGSSEPSGWKFCSGQAISRTTFAALFNAIGTTYGNGDGSTTFNVPDLRDRFPLGENTMGASDAGRVGTDTTALGDSGGADTHTLTISEMPSHDHGGSTGSHTHNIDGVQMGSGDAHDSTSRVAEGDSGSGGFRNNSAADSATASISSQGGGGSHNNMPPFQTVNFIIKT